MYSSTIISKPSIAFHDVFPSCSTDTYFYLRLLAIVELTVKLHKYFSMTSHVLFLRFRVIAPLFTRAPPVSLSLRIFHPSSPPVFTVKLSVWPSKKTRKTRFLRFSILSRRYETFHETFSSRAIQKSSFPTRDPPLSLLSSSTGKIPVFRPRTAFLPRNLVKRSLQGQRGASTSVSNFVRRSRDPSSWSVGSKTSRHRRGKRVDSCAILTQTVLRKS